MESKGCDGSSYILPGYPSKNVRLYRCTEGPSSSWLVYPVFSMVVGSDWASATASQHRQGASVRCWSSLPRIPWLSWSAYPGL